MSARVALVWALAALPSTVLAGQADGFSNLTIPGGRSTLALAGVPASTPRALALPLAIRLLHGDPAGSTAEQDGRLAGVRARLRQLADVRSALGGHPGGEIVLPPAGDTAAAERATAALASLGLQLEPQGDAFRVTQTPGDEAAALRAALGDAGLDADAVAGALSEGGRARPAIATITVPLPLEPATWSTMLLEPSLRELPLGEALLLDRQASLVACGLYAMDAPTRAWLAANPSVLKRLSLQAGTLCAFGRSLRVEQDRVQLPGGPSAVPAWEALTGIRFSQPLSFVPALFTRDEGRLAYFLDTLSQIDPRLQASVLGVGVEDGLDRAKDTYAAFLESTGLWRPADRPFLRPLHDAALLLDELVARPDGTLAGPRWQRFWRIAFDDASLPQRPARLLRKMEKDGPADAGALVRAAMLSNVDERRARFEQIAFVQRVMPAPTDAELPDVLVAARGFARFPGLMLHLERLGATAPALLGAAARRAAALDAIGDEKRRYQAIAQFQGALALLDGAVAGRYLQRADAVRLATTLVAVEAVDGEYLGTIARWIGEELAPALHAAAGASVEAAVLRSWSGPRETPPPQPLSWEGQQYLVDPMDAELDRLRRLRAIQGPSGLDEALALARALASVASAPGGDAARAAASALAGPASALVATPDGPLPALDPVDEVVGRLTSALAGGRHDAKAMAAALAPLWRHVDRALARALVSLAYTRHLGDPDTSVLTGDGLAERHEFGPPGTPSSAWARPRDGGDETGRHLHGGLVGLDLALARLSLRRLSTDEIPPARTANENTIDEVRQTVTLSFRQPPTEAEIGAVAAALDKGRARVEAAQRDAGALDRLAVEARVSESRRSVLAWMVREEPDAVLAVFAPAELRRLGTEDPLPSAFGTSAADLGGCWCLRVPPARPWEHVSARPGQPRVAAQAVDLGLRLAAEMRALGVPAPVYPSLLALAAEEFLDRAATRFAEDWPALVEAAATLGRERVEDYVSGLAGTGPLRMRQEPTR